MNMEFTRDEWDMMHWALDNMLNNEEIWWMGGDRMIARNIMDRIEKNLGVE